MGGVLSLVRWCIVRHIQLRTGAAAGAAFHGNQSKRVRQQQRNTRRSGRRTWRQWPGNSVAVRQQHAAGHHPEHRNSHRCRKTTDGEQRPHNVDRWGAVDSEKWPGLVGCHGAERQHGSPPYQLSYVVTLRRRLICRVASFAVKRCLLFFVASVSSYLGRVKSVRPMMMPCLITVRVNFQ